jgi:hypothetical protein
LYDTSGNPLQGWLFFIKTYVRKDPRAVSSGPKIRAEKGRFFHTAPDKRKREKERERERERESIQKRPLEAKIFFRNTCTSVSTTYFEEVCSYLSFFMHHLWPAS